MRFGEDPLAFFSDVYRSPAPWDIGEAQPALISLIEDFPPTGPILDIGCGSGDLAIALARLGHEVVGIDFVEEAVRQARARTSKEPDAVAARVTFEVADALHPTLLRRQFGSVVDSGFYHLFDSDEGAALILELARTLQLGGRYYVLAFAVELPAPRMPRAISEQELRSTFDRSVEWRVLEIRHVEFFSRVATVPAICACIERV